MEKVIIAAVADDLVIGKGNQMPWHLSEDLKFFKKTTLGCPVIMGSKTFLSLGSKPLPKRTNIVISSRTPSAETAGQVQASAVHFVSSLEEAYSLAGQENPARCFVIGGGKTYAQAIRTVDKMIITHIHTRIEDADTYFPQISADVWKKTAVSEIQKDPQSGLEFEFVEYERIK